MRSRGLRDHAAALRSQFYEHVHIRIPDPRVSWFSIRGELGGRPVSALWDAGRLTCDPSLLTQAQLLVDLGTVFTSKDPPANVEATLTGAAAAIMLTLARSCDRVFGVEFDPKSTL